MNSRIVFLSGISILLLGCSRVSYPAPDPAKTPQASLRRLGEALKNLDRNELISCFSGTDAQKSAVDALMNYAIAAKHFQTAFVKAYGQAAWDTFEDPAKGPEEGNARLTPASLKELEDSINASIKSIEVTGSKATFDVPNESRKATLVNQGSGWLIDATSFVPPGADPNKFAEMMNTFAATITKYEAAIGRPGISGEDIDAELGRAMLKQLMGLSTPVKHRFDIDHLP